jgi:hypothetical protein
VWHSRLRFRSPSPHTVSRRQRTVQSAMIRSCSASSNGRKSAEVSGCACRPSRPRCLEAARVPAGLALAIPEVLVFDEKASNGRRAGRGLEYMELKPAVRFPRLEKGLSNRTDRCCRRGRQMIAAGSLRSPAALLSGPAAERRHYPVGTANLTGCIHKCKISDDVRVGPRQEHPQLAAAGA